jgi:hypothetical protein
VETLWTGVGQATQQMAGCGAFWTASNENGKQTHNGSTILLVQAETTKISRKHTPGGGGGEDVETRERRKLKQMMSVENEAAAENTWEKEMAKTCQRMSKKNKFKRKLRLDDQLSKLAADDEDRQSRRRRNITAIKIHRKKC